MATIRLVWTPGSSITSTGQLIKRKNGIGAFTTIDTVSSVVNIYDDSTASNNVLYTYKVTNQCVTGSTVDSDLIQVSNITCPIITLTPGSTTIIVDLPILTGDVEYVSIVLYNGLGVVVSTQAISGQSTVHHTFTGLTSSTYYTGIVVLSDGVFTKNCSFSTNTTV